VDAHDSAAAHYGAGGDIEFLAYASAQNSSETIGVVACDSSMVVRDFIGNPSAAGHDLKNCNSMPIPSFERARL
jgi:hypothetical protein